MCAHPFGLPPAPGVCLRRCASDVDCPGTECVVRYCAGPGWAVLGSRCETTWCEEGLVCAYRFHLDRGFGTCAPADCEPPTSCVDGCLPAHCPVFYTCDLAAGRGCPGGSVCGRLNRCTDAAAAADCNVDWRLDAGDCPQGTFCRQSIYGDPTSPTLCLTPEEEQCFLRCRDFERCDDGRCVLP